MFTGIIQNLGRIEDAHHGDRGSNFEVFISNATDVVLGESIALDGVCLTVAAKDTESTRFRFEVCPETLRVTQFGKKRVGETVHVERALRVGDRLSGHWVQGHVDGVAVVTEIRPLGSSLDLTLNIPETLMRFAVSKGSIAIDGVSLTIHEILSENRIRLQLIPHTVSVTKFGSLRVGDRAHVEMDVLSKFANSGGRHGATHASVV